MLRNCACFQRQRRGSSFEDSSSCRSSEIERGSEVSTNNGSILKLITSRGWCRQWRKTGSTISMSKIERSKYSPFIYKLYTNIHKHRQNHQPFPTLLLCVHFGQKGKKCHCAAVQHSGGNLSKIRINWFVFI